MTEHGKYDEIHTIEYQVEGYIEFLLALTWNRELSILSKMNSEKHRDMIFLKNISVTVPTETI